MGEHLLQGGQYSRVLCKWSLGEQLLRSILPRDQLLRSKWAGGTPTSGAHLLHDSPPVFSVPQSPCAQKFYTDDGVGTPPLNTTTVISNQGTWDDAHECRLYKQVYKCSWYVCVEKQWVLGQHCNLIGLKIVPTGTTLYFLQVKVSTTN